MEVIVPSLTIGGMRTEDVRIDILPDYDGPKDDTPKFAGWLGPNFWNGLEAEFDLANGKLRLFSAKDCAGRPLAYWSTNFAFTPFRQEGLFKLIPTVDVLLNGKKTRAWITTNIAYSAMDMGGAKRAGYSPSTPGVKPIDMFEYAGVNKGYLATLDSFALGDEEIRNAKFAFADIWRWADYTATGSRTVQHSADYPQLLLGVDFLQSHRVLFSDTQKLIYFTYNGGPVFRAATEAGAGKAP